MKFAVLFPGHVRTFELNYQSHMRYFINKYGIDNVDFFVWCWDDLGFWSPDNTDGSFPPDGVYNKSGKLNKEWLENLLKPKKICVEKVEDHREIINQSALKVKEKHNTWTRVYNIVSCWYVIYQCDLLRRKYELENNFKYDIVIRSRFDIEYTKDLVFDNKFTFASDVGGNSKDDGYGDGFFYGSSDDMTTICDLYINLEEIMSRVAFNSHTAFKYWVDKNKPGFSCRDIKYILNNTPGGYCKVESLK